MPAIVSKSISRNGCSRPCVTTPLAPSMSACGSAMQRPFAGYFDLGDWAIASASPERFLKVPGGAVETRPIKGTVPRGSVPEEDAYAALTNC